MGDVHALFSPSVLHRRLACPGSAKAEVDLPDKPSSYAEEGTAAHLLGQLTLTSRVRCVDHLAAVAEAYPAVTVDEEMAEAVQRYVDAVREEVDELGGELRVEQKVDFGIYMPEGVPGFGTCDAIDLSSGLLSVHDYKHGRGVQVDAERNPQLLAYALGAHTQYGALFDYDAVRMTIHQPRLGHVSSWEISTQDLERWGFTLAGQVSHALVDNPVRVPGEKQCRFCKAAGTCEALAQYNVQTVLGEFSVVNLQQPITVPLEQVGDLPPLAVATLLNELDLIELWVNAVREAAQGALERGQDIPGWKLVAGRKGARQWTDEAEAEAALKTFRLKVEEMYDMKVISPTTAEKRLKESPRRWAKLQALITQKDGKPTIAPASDKRPAITPVVNQFDNVNVNAAPAAGEHPWQR